MAPIKKKNVKSIKKQRDNPTAKLRKPRRKTRDPSSCINKLLKRTLKKRADGDESLPPIYRLYRTIINLACRVLARRHRKITLKDARIVKAKTIPQEEDMTVIGKFRHTPGEKAIVITVEATPINE